MYFYLLGQKKWSHTIKLVEITIENRNAIILLLFEHIFHNN